MTEVKDAFGHVLKVGDHVCGAFLHGNRHRVRKIIAIGPQSAADKERLKHYGDRARTCVRVEGGWFMADQANKVLAPGHIEVSEEMHTILEHDAHWLGCLENAGVDNWQGYDYAREILRDDAPCPCAQCVEDRASA